MPEFSFLRLISEHYAYSSLLISDYGADRDQ
ncbi:Uncharacterised protein [Mycobacteroides abscessus subsp. abscessus]|nr:Uncharacterised protein [Mycobacteroides abscessus subsp. abscessus]SHY15952.1 Uncharacterised protein [Mycobacteroides abscessus subsp. abscessus]SIB55046.1 Uncharacterised protein [Mycobacteroides abscessus subsp. abscessus]SIB94518.1 Uncharacterised protein [Mycobacteroides abscessus subsp. abscessus]SIC80952.1 Uncharacterised protein [Mycobacteroides abscessus subsp. abscessus]